MLEQVDTGNAGGDLWRDGYGRACWSDGERVRSDDLRAWTNQDDARTVRQWCRRYGMTLLSADGREVTP